MQDYIIAFSKDALKLDALARIFFRHALEVLDERLLAVADEQRRSAVRQSVLQKAL